MMSREGSQAIGERIPGLARDASADSLSSRYDNLIRFITAIRRFYDSIELDAAQ